MVAGNKLFLESVSPAVRIVLVRERVRAMQGQFDEALHALEQAVQLVGDERIRDVVALATLRAELLHLNRQDREALIWYRERVLPQKDQLDTEEQFVVEQNLADLEFSTWSPNAGTTFYGLVDRRRLAGFEWFDAEAVLAAQNAAAEGKHYEALPVFWQQSVRAYLQGCWLSARLAAVRFAGEALQLGLLIDAAYHAVTAPREELVERVAEAVLRRRDTGLVREMLHRVMAIANLRRHFCVACSLLHYLGDAIPNEDLPAVAEWLLARCAESPDGSGTGSVLNMAWHALQPVAHRLEPALARRTVEKAFTHPAWTTRLENPGAAILEREQMVKTVNQLVAAVNTDDLRWIAQETLPLALDRRQIHDYNHVINLLCHTADRGGPAVKEQIAAALIPSDRPLDRMLIQAAPLLRDERPAVERVASLADQIAGEIRLQVQVVGPGEQPTQVSETIMTRTDQLGDQVRAVHLVGGVGLHAVARYRQLLPREALQGLLGAVLTMVQDRENFLGNRAMLLRGLMEFADRVDARTRRNICAVIEPIAKGNIAEPTGQPTAAEVANPLNPFKLNFGQIGELRLIALLTLAEFARDNKSLTRRVGPVLEEAVYDPDPDVRRGAYAAAARLPKIPKSLLLAVLMGGRDPDPDVASAAFFAMAKQSAWKLTQNDWRAFLHTLRVAGQSPDDKIRRNAAAAASAWAGRAPTEEIQAGLVGIQALFQRDICASVREAAGRPV